MLRYAGVDLLADPDDLLQGVRDQVDLESLDLFGYSPVALCDNRSDSVGRAEPHTPFPRPNYPPPPPIALNRLYWPTGATRWAHFVGIVDRPSLLTIQAAIEIAESAGASLAARTLVVGEADYAAVVGPRGNGLLTDPANRGAVATSLYMLPPRPIVLSGESIGAVAPDCFLLPLVDARYFWQWMPVLHRIPDDLLTGRTETAVTIKESWDGWRRILERSLGLTTLVFDPDPIHPDLFFPDRVSLDRAQFNAAVVLDAVAHSSGRRFVRKLTGDCVLEDAAVAQARHVTNAAQPYVLAGGPIAIAADPLTTQHTAVGTSVTRPRTYARKSVVPEFIDVSCRKLAEYDSAQAIANLPDDGPAPDVYGHADLLYGPPGTRTIRNKATSFGQSLYAAGAIRSIHTPSWVGKKMFDLGTGTCPEPPGAIDDAFYGDRYFRMATRISADWYDWHAQQHEYAYHGVRGWEITGLDDCVVWDAGRAGGTVLTHATGLPADFGVSTQLIQVYRQCDFDPNQCVAIVTGDWALWPPTLTELDACEIDVCRTIDRDGDNLWDLTWKWAQVEARPLIATDAHASAGSQQYGRQMLDVGDAIVAVTRSQEVIQKLQGDLAELDSGCCDTSLPSGVLYLRHSACEWQVVERDTYVAEVCESSSSSESSSSESSSSASSSESSSASSSASSSDSASDSASDFSTSATSGGSVSSAGSASDLSTSGEVSVPCCPSDPVPTSITAEITIIRLRISTFPITSPTTWTDMTCAPAVLSGVPLSYIGETGASGVDHSHVWASAGMTDPDTVMSAADSFVAVGSKFEVMLILQCKYVAPDYRWKWNAVIRNVGCASGDQHEYHDDRAYHNSINVSQSCNPFLLESGGTGSVRLTTNTAEDYCCGGETISPGGPSASNILFSVEFS
jgi:hypothetical protein